MLHLSFYDQNEKFITKLYFFKMKPVLTNTLLIILHYLVNFIENCQLDTEKCLCTFTNTNKMECIQKLSQPKILNFVQLQSVISLSELYIKNKLFVDIKFINSTNHATTLVKLIIESNNISIIYADSFLHFINLNILHLNDNDLIQIQPQAFTGLSSLKNLILYGNRIKIIKQNTFNS